MVWPHADARADSRHFGTARTSGLVPERIDMGVDFGGAGQVYALGNAVAGRTGRA